MFLQGVEMGHILMIDKYIFGRYPEFLRIRALRDNMEAMNNAWHYLSSLEPGERYFAKILYTKDETAALNRNNFSLLATAAISAAKFGIPSMQFYRGGNITGTSGALDTVVTQYLNMRLNLSYYAISYSPYSYMSDQETVLYLCQAEQRQPTDILDVATRPDAPQPGRALPRFVR
jgi:hypothetical protein